MYRVERKRTAHGPELVFATPFNMTSALIDRHIDEGRGAKTAIVTLEETVSYADLAKATNRFGNAMLGLGFRPGDRVLMILKGAPEFFYAFFGAVKAGLIPVPLNTLLKAADYAFIMTDSGAKGLVYSSEFAPEIEAALGQCTPPSRVLPMMGPDGLAALAANAASDLSPVPSTAESDCFWLYSSGTTGRPKGVIHVHRDVIAVSQLYAVDVGGVEESDLFYSTFPLFFAAGLGCGALFPLWVGATTIVDGRRPSPPIAVEIIQRFRPTYFAAVPTFYAALLASNLIGRDGLSSIKRCITGGEALPAEIQRQWCALAPVPIMEGIGSTESLHIYITNRTGDVKELSTGRAVPGYQIRILDDAGKEVPPGEQGRMWVKGPSVTRGYWNNPERNATHLVDGWLNTGDTFVRDAEGYYYFAGRSDDMLKVGGIWVSPFEIESALFDHPKVLEAAVVGRRDEAGLFKPEAWVVLKSPSDAGDDLAEDLRQHCRTRLAAYKYPRWFNFVTELPKTATGKIQRFKLRKVD
ncbi:MAG: benzoate-CoA ligase family protein [Rhodospirillales bacterium]|nr:benzoate-CoA ligase family protein [Rhodospirillales bacterium]